MAESIFSIGGIAALFGAGMRVGEQGHFDVVAVLLCLIAGCLLGVANRLCPMQPPRQPLLDHLSNRSQSVHADSIHGAESRINPTLKQKGPTA